MGNSNETESDTLYVEFNIDGNVAIPHKFAQIPSKINTIKFTEDNLAESVTTMEYFNFLSSIPNNVKTLIYDFNFQSCLKYKSMLCTQLPEHIQTIELNVYANTKEIVPYLNNLPFNLKLLKINNIAYMANRIPALYKFVVHNNDTINENGLLLTPNIKLPFGYKIQLPDGTIYDNLEKLYFKLKYNAPVFSQFGGKKKIFQKVF